MVGRFSNRREAGRAVAAALEHLVGQPDVVVLALPRGGVPVAFEVACALGAPLDVFVVRKLGVPGQEELAMGAIASGGTRVINDEVTRLLRIPDSVISATAEREARELERREKLYRGSRRAVPVRDRTVVLVDDGVATGSSVLAAIEALRSMRPARIILAVPVAARSVTERLRGYADSVVCVTEADDFFGVSVWYDDFSQTSDVEVRSLLDEADARQGQGRTGTAAGAGSTAGKSAIREVRVDADGVVIDADLGLPESSSGLVIFAHGSGSSRKSKRNRYVASVLQDAGLATLLLDLLTRDEEAIDQRTRHLRFDIGLLTDRLVAATDWVSTRDDLRSFDVGFFGASTGAAAALIAAARRSARVRAVVSRGGRPDMADEALAAVRCPTLLIVGGHDHQVLELNKVAFGKLVCERKLDVVPGATHLFEEPGTLEIVASLALDWFRAHLGHGTEQERVGGSPPDGADPS